MKTAADVCRGTLFSITNVTCLGHVWNDDNYLACVKCTENDIFFTPFMSTRNVCTV